MPAPGPHRVVLGRHAAERAHQYDWALADVTDLLLAQHPHRTRNAGRAGWRVVLGDMTVLYDWPDGDDPGTARVVTLWRSD